MAPNPVQPRADTDGSALSPAPAPTGLGARLLPALRWLAVPLLVALLVMVGMATTATRQDRSDRGDQTAGAEAGDQTDGQPMTRPDAADSEIEPVTVTARTDRGDVDITFDVDGVVRLSPTEAEVRTGQDGQSAGTGTGPPVDVVPGTDTGFTLSEDGRLEPAAPGEWGDNDLGFRSDRDGVIVDVPGDSPILLRPNGERGGVSASDVDPDYETISPDENGEVVLADGTTVSPIEDPAPAVALTAASDDLPWAWVFGTIAVVALVSALTGYLLHRKGPEPMVTDAGFMVTAGVDAMSDSGFEHFLHELAVDPDPARAVRLGFHAAEQGLGVLPPRRRAETPNEWAARVGATRPELSVPLTSLCDVFARARFGPEPASDEDRFTVIDRLRTLRSLESDRSFDDARSERVEAAGAPGGGWKWTRSGLRLPPSVRSWPLSPPSSSSC